MGLLVGSLQTHFWWICKCMWWVANMCVERVTLNSKLWFALSLYSQAHASCSACTLSECNTADIHNEQHSVSVTILKKKTTKKLLHLHRGTNWYPIKFAFCLQNCSQNTQHKTCANCNTPKCSKNQMYKREPERPALSYYWWLGFMSIYSVIIQTLML